MAFVLVAQCAAAYDQRLVHVLDQLRECKDPFYGLPMVGGAAIGDAATPHEFFLLVPYVLRVASEKDLKEMLADKSPVVRIMGAKCAVMRGADGLKNDVDGLLKDQSVVCVAPYGCSIEKSTVGEVIAELKKHPAFLQDEEEWQPNKTSEPTAMTRPPPATIPAPLAHR
jgi:hypothetical protein